MDTEGGRSGKFTVTFGEGNTVTINVQQNKGEMPTDAKNLKELEAALEGENNNALNWSSEPDYTKWTGVKFEGSNLAELNLSGKGLKGYIPASISQFTSLRVLDLSNNELVATPDLPDIKYGNESLSGGVTFKPAVPVSLIDLTNLEVLKLSGNNIKGVFPSDLVAHPHYFDWNAMENIYPQKGDNADISYTYGSGVKYNTQGDPSKWQLRLTSTGILRVMYYQMGGESWTSTKYEATTPEWLDKEIYFTGGTKGTSTEYGKGTDNPLIFGVWGVGGSKDITGQSFNLMGIGGINNLKGQLPLEVLFNQGFEQIWQGAGKLEGQVHPLAIQRLKYIQVSYSPDLKMDVADILHNLHPQVKKLELKNNMGLYGTVTGEVPGSLAQEPKTWGGIFEGCTNVILPN